MSILLMKKNPFLFLDEEVALILIQGLAI